MKRLIPFALLLCLYPTISGFTILPVRHFSVQPQSVTWPVTGTTGSSVGTVNYSISGSGNVPSAITFTQGTTSYGTYAFTPNGSSTNSWIANGMKSTLNISEVLMGIFADGSGYTLDFHSPY